MKKIHMKITNALPPNTITGWLIIRFLLIFNTLSVLNIDAAGLTKPHVFKLRRSKMSEFSYESGRLNLPFVGFCTFAKAPVCEDWDNIKADVAVLGVPNR